MSDFENNNLPERENQPENTGDIEHQEETGFTLHNSQRQPGADAGENDNVACQAPVQKTETYTDETGGQAENASQQNNEYTDVNYISPDDPYRDLNRGYKRHWPDDGGEGHREKKGFSFRKVVAMCLACLIIGGAGTYGITRALHNGEDLPDDTAAVTETEKPENSPALSVSNNTSGAMDATDIYNLACTQTVGIQTEITYNVFGQTVSGAVSGSGFVVTEDGYILTNYHVIEEAAQNGYPIKVMFYDGSSYEAEIIGYEEENDLAVLKIEADQSLNPVTIGDSSEMQVGNTIYVVGNPLGELTYTMTKGMVSALDREIVTESEMEPINMFQIDAAVNSGNSGGPVYNDQGEVIGIVTAKYSDSGVEGLGFAIPIGDALDIANDIIEHGYVTGKPYMGITVTTVDASVAQYYNMVEGASIYAIDPDGAAAEAGLQRGDIITKIGDVEVKSSSDLIAAEKEYAAGDSAVLTVYRNGEYLEITIVFDEEAPSNTSAQNTNSQSSDYYSYEETLPTDSPWNEGIDPFSNFNF